MKLTDLEPQFIRYENRVPDGQTEPTEHYVYVSILAEAQGIKFMCPGCVDKSGHWLSVSFADRGVPDDLGSHSGSRPTRWQVSGSGYDDLTLDPSILIDCWHGFVRAGAILTA